LTPNSLMLEVRDLVTYYGKIQILHGVSLEAREKEILAIIGPNGAGKSTVLRTIFGLVPPRGGTIEYQGKDITRKKPQSLVRLGISFVPQNRAVFPSLTVKENLEMGAYTRHDHHVPRDIENTLEQFPLLKPHQNKQANTLSGGERQMLALAMALMLKPKLLLLDEPTIGLSPLMRKEIMEKIKEIRDHGTTIIMVEQNARIALETADRAYVLENGRNRLEDTGKNLLQDQRIKQIYLGEI